MAIQWIKGYREPGDESISPRPQKNATDENEGQGVAPWYELERAEEFMSRVPGRHENE